MSKKRKNNQLSLLVIVLGVLLLIIILNLIFSKSSKNKNSETKIENIVGISVEEQAIEDDADKLELEKVKAMSERTRIEYYVAKYIRLIEDGDYDKAYSLLNVDYKKNYFNTKSEFEEYCKSNFSKMQDVQYNNFERNGDLYVIWITVTDTINGRQNAGKEMSFVIKENTFNDYELSFSKN